MKYKYFAILITVVFILSCLNGVFAHPGHGTEYVEEVSSSSSSLVILQTVMGLEVLILQIMIL